MANVVKKTTSTHRTEEDQCQQDLAFLSAHHNNADIAQMATVSMSRRMKMVL
jgi:hypothetical protein